MLTVHVKYFGYLEKRTGSERRVESVNTKDLADDKIEG